MINDRKNGFLAANAIKKFHITGACAASAHGNVVIMGNKFGLLPACSSISWTDAFKT